jgi:hypothetical protein
MKSPAGLALLLSSLLATASFGQTTTWIAAITIKSSFGGSATSSVKLVR